MLLKDFLLENLSFCAFLHFFQSILHPDPPILFKHCNTTSKRQSLDRAYVWCVVWNWYLVLAASEQVRETHYLQPPLWSLTLQFNGLHLFFLLVVYSNWHAFLSYIAKTPTINYQLQELYYHWSPAIKLTFFFSFHKYVNFLSEEYAMKCLKMPNNF